MTDAALALFALIAAAQPAPPAEVRSVRIFISPAGEPYRVSTGDYPSRIWFDQADSNRDGRLTAAEMMIQARTFFKKLDLDRDGRIDGDEIRNYEENVAPETRVLFDPIGTGSARSAPPSGSQGGIGGGDNGQQDPNRGPDRPKDIPRGAGRFSFFNVAEPVMRADTDLSRSVSVDEFDSWQQQQFFALDAKRQGFVLFEELPRTPSQGARIKVKSQRRIR